MLQTKTKSISSRLSGIPGNSQNEVPLWPYYQILLGLTIKSTFETITTHMILCVSIIFYYHIFISRNMKGYRFFDWVASASAGRPVRAKWHLPGLLSFLMALQWLLDGSSVRVTKAKCERKGGRERKGAKEERKWERKKKVRKERRTEKGQRKGRQKGQHAQTKRNKNNKRKKYYRKGTEEERRRQWTKIIQCNKIYSSSILGAAARGAIF